LVAEGKHRIKGGRLGFSGSVRADPWVAPFQGIIEIIPISLVHKVLWRRSFQTQLCWSTFEIPSNTRGIMDNDLWEAGENNSDCHLRFWIWRALKMFHSDDFFRCISRQITIIEWFIPPQNRAPSGMQWDSG
jgi:hypothetical protein